MVGGCALLEEVGEGRAGVALCGVAMLLELRERVVVGLNGLVGGLQRERAHSAVATLRYGGLRRTRVEAGAAMGRYLLVAASFALRSGLRQRGCALRRGSLWHA
jgi:hypothetical protein